MKLFTLLFFNLNIFASLINPEAVGVYIGDEVVMEKPTGNICYVTVNRVAKLEKKGMHCHETFFHFHTNRTDHPKGILRVDSRITNYHRSEYPRIKTCAMNVDGTTYGEDIYGSDTTDLYNRSFSGTHKVERTQYDYFLSFSAEDKMPTRARIHVLTWIKEYDIDCVNLEKM